MKKSKLIKMLQEIEGDPEIKLWNGYVGDWVDILPAIEKVSLVRMTQEYWLESCRLEDCLNLKDFTYQLSVAETDALKKNYKNICKWELNGYVTNEDIARKKYATKPVYILQAKLKGETNFDRLGDLKY